MLQNLGVRQNALGDTIVTLYLKFGAIFCFLYIGDSIRMKVLYVSVYWDSIAGGPP